MEAFDESRILNDLKQATRKRSAFERLVKHFSEPLYWQIRKMVLSHDDANDVLQNAFIKIWTNIDQFRGDSKLSTWMYRIAINETYTFLNKERARNQASFTDLEDRMVLSLQSDPYFSGDETELKLQKAILSLPDKQRLVFTMKYYEDMKYEDMSEILGTSVGALKASYFHAVRKVEAYMTMEESF
ncbi:MAG: sigma-70 family RNA polymerase sigma factor [Bacteroidales bacterium]|jgi:RNA polymerase sigma-70 factor (ECF subfamily)|nr:sigma-70 family RNA polymerase sigma factor [Bacteroidales bacterium]MDD3165944.1 sigma-70 family RNA polymerase sigma factor [Bacteroidales bacterium]MDD4770067.1 sigma-70 family RNA polymerase sigma factor [Bacteroidales bacterium]HKL93456.1 sigma-70 family RNA polymerase sigma factor [Bacteroidales bacterium]